MGYYEERYYPGNGRPTMQDRYLEQATYSKKGAYSMQYGVCCDPIVAKNAAQAGFDFCEWTVGALLKPLEPREAFVAALETVQTAPLPYPVLNCFVPGDLKITGPDADMARLKEYATTTFVRAEQAQVELIVFGSGAARRIPAGFDTQLAHEQLISFCAMVASVASNHGVVVVLEHLYQVECNVLNTIAECAALVREIANPSFRLLVDSYHLMKTGDSYDDIVAHADLLSHVHTASAANRLAPGIEPCNLAPFFAALVKGGYEQRISIEANLVDPAMELPTALSLMRHLIGGSKHPPKILPDWRN